MKVVLLCAGRGSRLDPLTALMPKCLVPVAGRAILDRQLEALAANGLDEVTIVGGYRCDAIASHIDRFRPSVRPELLLNPFWGVASSIGSVWTARALLAEPFCIVNGDTVFDEEVIADALAGVRPGVNLVVERSRAPQLDDMRVNVAGGQVRAVGKRLMFDAAPFRSLGIVLCPDLDGGPYRAALDSVIGSPGGLERYHHDIVDMIAAERTVTPILVAPRLWGEIDRAEDIAELEDFLSQAA